MIAVKNGRILQGMGLTGVCSVSQTLPDGTQIEECRGGKLAGRPDLSSQGCRTTAVLAQYEYWHCPAAVASATRSH